MRFVCTDLQKKVNPKSPPRRNPCPNLSTAPERLSPRPRLHGLGNEAHARHGFQESELIESGLLPGPVSGIVLESEGLFLHIYIDFLIIFISIVCYSVAWKEMPAAGMNGGGRDNDNLDVESCPLWPKLAYVRVAL